MIRITSFFVVVDLQIVQGAVGPHCEGLKIELRRRDRFRSRGGVTRRNRARLIPSFLALLDGYRERVTAARSARTDQANCETSLRTR